MKCASSKPLRRRRRFKKDRSSKSIRVEIGICRDVYLMRPHPSGLSASHLPQRGRLYCCRAGFPKPSPMGKGSSTRKTVQWTVFSENGPVRARWDPMHQHWARASVGPGGRAERGRMRSLRTNAPTNPGNRNREQEQSKSRCHAGFPKPSPMGKVAERSEVG